MRKNILSVQCTVHVATQLRYTTWACDSTGMYLLLGCQWVGRWLSLAEWAARTAASGGGGGGEVARSGEAAKDAEGGVVGGARCFAVRRDRAW